jgi:hypothetical protein
MKIRQVPLIALLLAISFENVAQDLIYKKNGGIVKVKILDTTNRYCSYRLFEKADSSVYFISNVIVDSIKYQNGKKEAFEKRIGETLQPGIKLNGTQEADTGYRHHLIGTDVAYSLFYHHLSFSYEFLPGKAHLGFKASYCVNLNQSGVYGDDYFSLTLGNRWLGRLGMNYYFFPPRTFRLGTGINYLTGTYESYIYNDVSGTYTTSNKKLNGITFCVFGFYNITKLLAFNLGFEFPVNSHPESYGSMLHCEALLNF